MLQYPFVVKLIRCNGSCNTLDDPSGNIYVPNKRKNVNIYVFNVTARINELKILTKHLPCECKCKLDGTKCNLNQKWNRKLCQYKHKNPIKHNVSEKDYVLNPTTYACEISIISNSVVLCDEIIDVPKAIPTKTVPTRTISTKTIHLNRKFLYFLTALLITISLFITVSIYCC